MRDGSNGSEETAGSETTGGAAGADGRRRELTVSLAVPEMDCPSCAGKVDNAIGRLDGVTKRRAQSDRRDGDGDLRPRCHR